MVDWATPTLTDLYQDFLDFLKQRDDDLAKMFDGSTSTGLPIGTIRWSDSNARFEKWDGTTWGELKLKYNINADMVDGRHASDLPGPGQLLALDANGNLPTNITGDADTVDGAHAFELRDRTTHSGVQPPVSISPQGEGSGLNADLLRSMVIYSGTINADGSSPVGEIPSGWSSSRTSTGVYQLVHNLNTSKIRLFVQPWIVAGNLTLSTAANAASNDQQTILLDNPNGTRTDSAINWMLVKYI